MFLVIPENAEEPVVRVVRQISGGAANAGASTQTFNQGGGFGAPGFGGGFGAPGFGASGSSANAVSCTILYFNFIS